MYLFMRKSKMKKAVATLAIVLGLCIATTAATASAAGKTENRYDTIAISNVTSTEKGMPEECKEATFSDGKNVYEYLKADEDVWNVYWEDATTYYCDAPTTLTFSVNKETGAIVTGINWWWWDGDDLTNNLLVHGDEYVTGDLVITEPGTYLITTSTFVSLLSWPDVFCIVVSDSKSTTPAKTTPAPSTPTPAPSSATAGDTAALKTTDGLVQTIPANPTKGQDLSYKVQKGEKLFTIAYNYYGSMQKSVIDKIYQANAAYFKSTKGALKAGAVLTLPAKGLLTPVTQSSLDKAAGMYLVKTGDTLGAIAKIYYGDSIQWKKIYEANKDRVKIVGKSPMIYEGQWLVIPE